MFSSALKSFTSNISTNYTLSTNPTTVAGAWKVFDGKGKKSGKTVSVFVFDRKSLEAGGGGFDRGGGSSARRKIHDEIVERLKKEASYLARLRHPSILELVEPIEETRNGGLMFATEPITATLAGLLTDQDTHDKGRARHKKYGKSEDGEQKELELDELEIQKGLLQVAKGLQFLHESANLVHANLTPESIYVNHKSDWKIAGLGFTGPPDESATTTPSTTPPIALSELLYHDPRLPRTVQLDINYASPDFVMDTNVSSAADMFSFGILLVALYSSPHESPLHTNGNISIYKKLFSSSSTIPNINNNFLSSKTLPRQLKTDVLPRLITRRPAQRMSAREFQESSFFDNVLVSTIRFLEALPAKTPNEKAQFMRGFPRVLDQFPKSVLGKKVLPALLEETKDKELLSLIFSNVFKILPALSTSQRVFVDNVIPKLREIFFSSPAPKGQTSERDNAKEAGLAVVLENMKLISEMCSGKEFKDDILPIVVLGLESYTHSVIDRSLSCLPVILTTLDFSTIKNELFPVVATVFSKTNSLAIKVKGLEAFVTLCGGTNIDDDIASSKANSSSILDKYTVQDKIVPLMKGIKTKEPAVMMASLAVFRQIGKIADSDFLAMEVLPIIWSFSLGPLLNMQQFRQYMELIKGLSSRIEQEHTRKLRDLSSTSSHSVDDYAKTNDLMSMTAISDGPFSPSGSVGEDDFERLVLGKGLSASQASTAALNQAASDAYTSGNEQPSQPLGWNNTYFNSSHLQPPKPASRAITPDQSLASFTPLSPTSSAIASRPIRLNSQSGSPALDPWIQNTQSQSSFRPSNTWSSPPQFSGNPNLNSSISSASIWTQPSQMQTQTQIGMNGNLGLSGLNSNAFAQQVLKPTQSVGSQNGFSLAPPPKPSNVQGNYKPKTGLDAYESLI